MKPRRIIWLLLVAGLAALCTFLWSGPREPEYGGKKLSAWVLATYGPQGFQATDAVRHIGTNALPFLIQWTKYKPGPLKTKWYLLPDHLPFGLPKRNFVKHLRTDKSLLRSKAAAFGFYQLGRDAIPAVPHLCWILTPSGNPVSENFWAAIGFFEVCNGDEVIGSLLTVLNDSSNPNRTGALVALGHVAQERGLYDTRADLIPTLLALAKEPDLAQAALGILVRVRMITTYQLRPCDPATIILALTENLHNPSPAVRSASVWAISTFHAAAQPHAWPLLGTLNDPDFQVRKETTNALVRIFHPEDDWRLR